MPTARSGKRKASPSKPSGNSSKRLRNVKLPLPSEIIEIDDSEPDEDPELKDILAQIKAQEDSERLARQLQDGYNESSSSNGKMIIDISMEADAAIAQRLAEEWAKEDNVLTQSTIDERSTSSAGAGSSSTCGEGKSLNPDASNRAAKPDDALRVYRNVFTKTRKCSNCGTEVKSPRGCVVFSDSSIPPSMAYLLHAPCTSCQTNHCRGCFSPVACQKSCKGPSRNPECNILTCCAEVRAVAIFETLGGFDRQFMSERAASDSRALAMSKKKSTSKSVGPGGTGYGTDATHYSPAAYSLASNSKQKVPEQTIEMKRTHWDNVILRTFDLLAELLPSPYTDNPQVYDMLPHASIGHLISLSQLPTLLATLLRNDSVTDWIARKETYNAMLSLLRRMADCELTIQCLIGQRWETATTCGLEDWMWDDGEITWTTSSTGDLEILPPLYTYFKKLTKQSEAFLAGATQMLGESDNGDEIDETVIQGTSLCGDIIAARDDLERVIAVLGLPSSSVDRDNRKDQTDTATHTRRATRGKGRDLTIHVDKLYEEACEKLCFKYVSLAENAATATGGLHYADYNYAAQLNSTQNSTRNPKSRLHLLKELAVTATSLPPGVWVRVDEVRNDAIKIMIAGPDGTPYAGGLFEFDCFIPIEYPNTPPLMHLRTTGGGQVRFNPNLYNNGKVCLSLLGTWPGRPEEQWSPKSTLLQVLVSIQSMILIDAPYYNEPGHGQANVKSPVSIAYNRNISLQTVKWAIVDWLQDKHCNGIWRDVIASHFTIKSEKIREQIVAWSKEGPSTLGTQVYPPVFSQYPYSTTAARVAQNDDLLAKFDKGMRTIESWKIGGDEEE